MQRNRRESPDELYLRWLYATLEIPFSEEEIERRRSATGGRSLADIWKDLGRSHVPSDNGPRTTDN